MGRGNLACEPCHGSDCDASSLELQTTCDQNFGHAPSAPGAGEGLMNSDSTNHYFFVGDKLYVSLDKIEANSYTNSRPEYLENIKSEFGVSNDFYLPHSVYTQKTEKDKIKRVRSRKNKNWFLDIIFTPFTDKKDFKGHYLYNLIEDRTADEKLYMDIIPQILKEQSLCVPVTTFITLKNTHSTDALVIESIYSDTTIIKVDKQARDLTIEAGHKKTIKVNIITDQLGELEHTLFINTEDGKHIIYKLNTKGVKNRYDVEPILEDYLEANT